MLSNVKPDGKTLNISWVESFEGASQDVFAVNNIALLKLTEVYDLLDVHVFESNSQHSPQLPRVTYLVLSQCLWPTLEYLDNKVQSTANHVVELVRFNN